jgi:hypothetical protein
MARTIDPNEAVDFIIKNAPLYAQAKAERCYIEDFLRSKKSLLMQLHNEKPIGAQEREAYAHPEYIELLKGLKAAVEKEELLKWQMTAAQMRADIWRSQEASNRSQDRATT